MRDLKVVCPGTMILVIEIITYSAVQWLEIKKKNAVMIVLLHIYVDMILKNPLEITQGETVCLQLVEL
jgi:L-cysteine desulfidase